MCIFFNTRPWASLPFSPEKLSLFSKLVHYSNIAENNSKLKAVSASVIKHIKMHGPRGELPFIFKKCFVFVFFLESPSKVK